MNFKLCAVFVVIAFVAIASNVEAYPPPLEIFGKRNILQKFDLDDFPLKIELFIQCTFQF